MRELVMWIEKWQQEVYQEEVDKLQGNHNEEQNSGCGMNTSLKSEVHGRI